MPKRDISKKWVVIWTVVGVIFVAGVVSVAQGLTDVIHTLAGSSGQKTPAKLTVVKDASKASFAFLVPPQSPNWQFDPTSPVFDQTEGVVDYQVTMAGGNKLTISQQPMPQNLKPANTSSNFNQFIISSAVAASEKIGNGELYFRSENGGPNGTAVTVIYATNSILMFGEAGGPTQYKTWASLFAAMQPVNN